MSTEPAAPARPATAAARQARWDELVARVNESYRFQQRAISEMLRELAEVSAVVSAAQPATRDPAATA